jgi:heat shock protein HslJ
MTAYKNRISGKLCVVGMLIICGLLLTSVDDCESMYLAETEASNQQRIAQEQAARNAKAERERAERERAEQEWRAAQTENSRTRPAAGAQSGSQVAGSQAAASQTADAQAAGSRRSRSRDAGSQSAGSPVAGSQTADAPVAGSQAAAPQTADAQAAASQTADTQAAGSRRSRSRDARSGDAGSQAADAQGAAVSGGTGDQSTASSGVDYLKSISGKDWKLLEVRLSDKTLTLDRNKLTADGMGDLFTLNVDAARLSGKAAPNRYISTYQAREDNSLTIAPPIGTLMASIYDPVRLREQEYFQYLSKVKSWKLNQGKLELYTTDANNQEAVLVYGN